MDENRSVAFHIEKDVLPAETLRKLVSEFFELLASASRDAMSDIHWLASIRSGSIALRAYPETSAETKDEVDELLSEVHNDFICIRGGKQPNLFSKKTLDHWSRLTSLLTHDGQVKGNPTIQVLYPKILDDEPISISPVSLEKAHPVRALGSAYGVVKTISEVEMPYLVLYDDITNKRIKVAYKPQMLDCVLRSFKKRVRVTGEVLYSPDGLKKQIDAIEIEIEDEDGPSVRLLDLFGVLGEGAR